MRVLFIGKYTPIEGGTSAASYWRIHALEQMGIEFEIVTCILKDSDYIIQGNTDKNVHLIQSKVPWHIPYSQLYSERLISLALELANIIDFDIVEGCYLFPYGFAAYVVAELLAKPLILRHAGSDLFRITKDSTLFKLLGRMTKRASIIITYKECVQIWKKINPEINLYFSERYVPNPNYFYSTNEQKDVCFLGKITDKWNRSQFDYFLNFIRKERYKGNINVFSNEYTINTFQDYFKRTEYRVAGKKFIMPNYVPDVLKGVKYLLVSEIPSGIPEESNIYLEGLMVGCIPVCMGKNTKNIINLDYSQYIKNQFEAYKGLVLNERG